MAQSEDWKKWSKFKRRQYAVSTLKNRFNSNDFKIENNDSSYRIIRVSDNFRVDFFLASWKYHAIDLQDRGMINPMEVIKFFQNNPSTVSVKPTPRDEYLDVMESEYKREVEDGDKQFEIIKSMFTVLKTILPVDHPYRQDPKFIEATAMVDIANQINNIPY